MTTDTYSCCVTIDDVHHPLWKTYWNSPEYISFSEGLVQFLEKKFPNCSVSGSFMHGYTFWFNSEYEKLIFLMKAVS